MNQKEIEKAANNYSESKRRLITTVAAFDGRIEGFIAGANWVLDQASEGFEEAVTNLRWIKDQDGDIWYSKSQCISMIPLTNLYQAARLSAEKEIEELRKDLDMVLSVAERDGTRAQDLQSKYDELKSREDSMIKHSRFLESEYASLKAKYDEAVKDINFMGLILEGDSYHKIGESFEEYYNEIRQKYGLE